MAHAHWILNTQGYKHTLTICNIAFPPQQRLHDRTTMLRCTYIGKFFSSKQKNAILPSSEVGLFLTTKRGLKGHDTPHYGSFKDFKAWVLDKEDTVSYVQIIMILPFILHSWGCRSLVIKRGWEARKRAFNCLCQDPPHVWNDPSESSRRNEGVQTS